MSNSQIAILSFYSFTNICELDILLQKILLLGKKKRIRGTVLIAKEGFNGSISGDIDNLNLLVSAIVELTGASFINSKVNHSVEHPFQKLKVKIKNEIINMGIKDLEVEDLRGEYIEPHLWDDFLKNDDVLLVDTRNNYEISAGTFRGALNPSTETFREFPDWVKSNQQALKGKRIAMFCTGGIRCEKSTAYLKKLGYNEVYHLKGGILQYLENTKNQNGTWKGKCFVFDNRRGVNSDLSPAEGYWLERK
ncbi:MAG: rhodanese-like domain-containing protein [Janthinobacterium lividum]